MKFCQASLDTRNFSFEAYGHTDDEARATLIDGLLHHARQYGLPADWWEDMADSITYRDIVIGDWFRDCERP